MMRKRLHTPSGLLAQGKLGPTDTPMNSKHNVIQLVDAALVAVLKASWLRIALLLILFGRQALSAAPVVSNLTASQRTGTKLVDITYDLSAPGFGAVAVTLEASSDGGATCTVPVTSVTGAVGAGVN